jgi:AraC family transcriptional regulator
MADNEMNSLEPSRFVDGQPMLLAGLRRHHSYTGAAESIPAQWQAFRALDDIPHRRGTVAYGVMCGADPANKTFEYMCAVEVAEFDDAAPHLGRMRVPAQHYAVFEHLGHVSSIWKTWDAIWHHWLPRSGYVPVNGPEFELYDERFVHTGTGGVEVWVSVQPAAGG